jgi:two-component system, chemotaxis family, chemotaxis protein CheY
MQGQTKDVGLTASGESPMDIHALVVDDSGIMRKMVMRSLKEADLANFTFTEAGDGVEALEKFDPKGIDMLFVDWNMPNMNGIELVRKVREIEKHHIPIVMITTESTMGKMDEAMDEVNVDKYIAKPFTVEGLQKRLTPLFETLAGQRKKGFFGKLAAALD